MSVTRICSASELNGQARSPVQESLLSVLYVDDEQALLDVTKSYLERKGDILVTGVTSAQRGLELLETIFFDVIISDYQMPDMDGIVFLKYLQAKNNTTPFILFTGKGREEVVIEAINNGATFYLQKGGDPRAQFAELEHKIKEAARRRQAEEALKESESRYRTVFENSGTAIVIIDEDATISHSNRGFSQLTGYANAEIDGKMSWTEFVIDEDLKIMLARDRLRRQEQQIPQHYEFRLATKSKEIRYISLSVDMIPGTTKSVASLIDITERKRVEKELRMKSEELKIKCEELIAAYGHVAALEDELLGTCNQLVKVKRGPVHDRKDLSDDATEIVPLYPLEGEKNLQNVSLG